MAKARLVQGNEACAQGAIAAGVRFFAGYPITPSTEIAEILAERLPRVGGRFIQMEDEIASMGAIIGASLAGVKSMTATSGPGFSLKQENIGYAAITEVPCVIVNVQRVGPSTGGPTSPAQGDVMQARWGTHGDHPIVVLSPWSVSETYHLTIEAVNRAEQLRTPVILLMDEVVGHMRERFEVPDEPPALIERPKPDVDPKDYFPYRPAPGSDIPPMASFGTGYRYHVTGLCHDEKGRPISNPEQVEKLLKRLHNKTESRRAELCRYEALGDDDPEVVLVAYGTSARSAVQAMKLLRQQGKRVRLFRPITLWPFPGPELVANLGDAKRCVVVEMNFGQLVYEVERFVAGRVRVEGAFKANGELIRPEFICEAVVGGEGRA